MMQNIAIIGALVFSILLNEKLRSDLNALQQQAFERGYMVECVGKSGYYWECEK